MDDTRRTLIARVAAWLALAPVLRASTAWAAPPTVEIIAFAHPPVESALKPLRDWLSSLGNRVRVVEIDMDSPAAGKRLQALGLKGHVPIVVLVNGQYRVTRKDGSSAELVSFPSDKLPPGTTRGWSVEDAQAAFKALMT